MVVAPARRLFTIDDYYRMAGVGIIGDDDRVELLEGEIIAMPPIGPQHADKVGWLTTMIYRIFVGRAHIRMQQPVRLGDHSEPEPDLVLARNWPGIERPYRAVHPQPKDLLLVVEVSDITLAYDLGDKQRAYARHGVLELWVLDLEGDRVVVHRDPGPGGYQTVETFRRGQSISPIVFPDIVLSIDEVLE